MLLISDLANDAVAIEMTAFHEQKCTSIMVMSLRRESESIGSLVLLDEKEEPFTEAHK